MPPARMFSGAPGNLVVGSVPKWIVLEMHIVARRHEPARFCGARPTAALSGVIYRTDEQAILLFRVRHGR